MCQLCINPERFPQSISCEDVGHDNIAVTIELAVEFAGVLVGFEIESDLGFEGWSLGAEYLV